MAVMAVALVASLPVRAWAGDLYADLDHDGLRDVVSIPTGNSRGLLVWLSSSKSLLHLQTRLPILRIAAADIDGDGGVDLVAADTSARLHVWHRAGGRLRRIHPRHLPAATGPAHGRGLQESPDSPASALAGSDSTDPACDATHPAHESTLARQALHRPAAGSATTSTSFSQLQSRAPPASH